VDAIERTSGHAQQSSGSATQVTTTGLQVLLSSSEAHHISKQLLHDLEYREIDYRYENIPIAHQETFQWIFEASTHSSRWSNFVEWIRSDGSLYWVTGKAGSGKSTLMRFLHDHEKTREALQEWTVDRPLAIGTFFFWNSGTEIQMSYEGLLRTLLHQLLKQMPNLVPVVFPYRVESRMLFDEKAFQRSDWNWEELIKAFRTLVARATQTTKLAIFIDGLDEFAGNPSELAQFIATLVDPNVKVCMSSRPWIIFEDSFGHGPHLRLEDLTYNDIKCYVTSKLTATVAFEAFQEIDPEISTELIDTVCAKSSGVFLWVHLVTQSLLDGISEGERLRDLRKRLDSLPADLETLFEKIMDSLTPTQYERASQLFQIVRASQEVVSLRILFFADEDDPDYAFNTPCKPLTQQEVLSKLELMRRRINACCKGLLYTEMGLHPDGLVFYLHRTVNDFLEKPEIWERLCHATDSSSFNLYLRLSNSRIALLKTRDPEEALDDDNLRWEIPLTVEYAFRANRDGTEYHIRAINELDRTLTHLSTVEARSGNFVPQNRFETDRFTKTFWDSTTLGIAIKCELVEWIRFQLQTVLRHRASEIASHLLFKAIRNSAARGDTIPALSLLPPSAKAVNLLFEFGANPHAKYAHTDYDDNETAWELLQQESLIKPGFFDQSIIDAFHEHSVDAKLTSENQKSTSEEQKLTSENQRSPSSRAAQITKPNRMKVKWSQFVSKWQKPS